MKFLFLLYPKMSLIVWVHVCDSVAQVSSQQVVGAHTAHVEMRSGMGAVYFGIFGRWGPAIDSAVAGRSTPPPLALALP